MRDQSGGGGEDGRGRAVIRLEPDDARPLEILLEAEDVFDLGAAPRIDRLIVIADAADIAVPLREQPEPEILHEVRVLVLVDQDVAERAVILREDVRVAAQHLGHVQQQIAEIGGIQCAEPVLIRGV